MVQSGRGNEWIAKHSWVKPQCCARLGGFRSTTQRTVWQRSTGLVANLYNVFVAATIDDFVCRRIAARLQGNDEGDRDLVAVSTAPVEHVCALPVSTAIENEIVARADASAAAVAAVFRESLSLSAMLPILCVPS